MTKEINADIIAYATVPNHLDAVVYLPEGSFKLTMVIANGKRFMAYENY
ncbi:hypothetical protein [Ginsengibacter hankyongi]|nr:hypothetical protein [Ginsengibacter hankyongi]